MSEPGLAPADSEAIAAFLDRRLSAEEREAFLERLDRDQALYEVFVETVRYRERAASAEEGELVAHPTRVWRGRRIAAAAALAAALAVAVIVPVLLRSEPLTAARLGRALAASAGPEELGEAWTDQGWSLTRGGATLSGERGIAFRLGVRAVDLDLALRLGLADEATRLAHQIEALLGEMEMSSPERGRYEQLRGLVSEDPTLEAALEMGEETERLLSVFLENLDPAFEFGRWAEGGRLAARVGDRSLLASKELRQSLERLRGQEWESAIEGDLEEIARLISAGSEGLDLERLERAFRSIIDRS